MIGRNGDRGAVRQRVCCVLFILLLQCGHGFAMLSVCRTDDLCGPVDPDPGQLVPGLGIPIDDHRRAGVRSEVPNPFEGLRCNPLGLDVDGRNQRVPDRRVTDRDRMWLTDVIDRRQPADPLIADERTFGGIEGHGSDPGSHALGPIAPIGGVYLSGGDTPSMTSLLARLRELAPHYIAIVALILIVVWAADLFFDLSRGARYLLAAVVAILYPLVLQLFGREPEIWS